MGEKKSLEIPSLNNRALSVDKARRSQEGY
jgi:hypothetical protein